MACIVLTYIGTYVKLGLTELKLGARFGSESLISEFATI